MIRDYSRSKLINYTVPDYVWDNPRDNRARYRTSFDDDFTTHTTLAVNNTQTRQARTLAQMYTVEASISAAVVTTALKVQATANGRNLFLTGEQPTIAVGATTSETMRVHTPMYFHRGENVGTVITQVDALQTGTLTVVLKETPTQVVPRPQIVPRSPRSRFTQDRELAANQVRPFRRPPLVQHPTSFSSASSGTASRVVGASGLTSQQASAAFAYISAHGFGGQAPQHIFPRSHHGTVQF